MPATSARLRPRHRRVAAGVIVGLLAVGVVVGVASSRAAGPTPVMLRPTEGLSGYESGTPLLAAGDERLSRAGTVEFEILASGCKHPVARYSTATAPDSDGAIYASLTVPSGVLANHETYGVRSRAQWSGADRWSAWSSCVTFTVQHRVEPLGPTVDRFGATPTRRPTLSARVPPSVTAATAVHFELRDAETDAVVASSDGTTAAPGGTSSFTPTVPLDEGREYVWSVSIPDSDVADGLTASFWAGRSPLEGRYEPRITVTPTT